MPFKVIKGTFHVVGYSPDGDSVRFKAARDSSWTSLSGSKVKLNSKKHAQLRMEAIDTLETHYKSERQPRQFADKAANKLFKLLGVSDVVWNASRSKVISAKDGVDGFVISRMAEKYGRPVSFVFNGSHDLKYGQDIYLDSALARKSVNYKLLSKGMAYPAFYDGLFYNLRGLFAKGALRARKRKMGVWSKDRTNKYLEVGSLADITEVDVILPKLFRRIAAYIKDNGGIFNAADFVSTLRKKPEKVLMLSILHFTHLDDLIAVDADGKIKLMCQPENLVFLG